MKALQIIYVYMYVQWNVLCDFQFEMHNNGNQILLCHVFQAFDEFCVAWATFLTMEILWWKFHQILECSSFLCRQNFDKSWDLFLCSYGIKWKILMKQQATKSVTDQLLSSSNKRQLRTWNVVCWAKSESQSTVAPSMHQVRTLAPFSTFQVKSRRNIIHRAIWQPHWEFFSV
jgi:hypothetical protein